MPSAFIPDGYTREATITSAPGATPAFDPFDITYRPMLRAERRRLLFGAAKAQDSGDDERLRYWEEQTVASVSGQIKSWTLKGADGKPVKITAANLGRLHPEAFERIYSLVAGYSEPPGGEETADSPQDADEKN